VRVICKAVSDLYTTRLHRRLFTLKYGGSYLNKILLVHVGISVKQVLPLILVCNLMLFFLNTLYARYRMNIKYIKKKIRKFRPAQQKRTLSQLQNVTAVEGNTVVIPWLF